MLGQSFDCRSHEPVYLLRMLTLRESEFPRYADYVKEFRTCVIKSKVNTSDVQMGYLVNSRFVEGLSNNAVRRQYLVEVRSKWRSGRPFGFETLVGTIAQAYMAAGYQLEEVQNASRPMGDTTGAAVSRPLPMIVRPTSTSAIFLSSPMPTPHLNPMPNAADAPMASTAPEPMNLNTIAKLREELMTRSRGGPATRRCGGHAQVSRQAKHYAHRGINALMSCDKAFQDPCHSATRERKYVQQHIRICTHGVKTGLG